MGFGAVDLEHDFYEAETIQKPDHLPFRGFLPYLLSFKMFGCLIY